MTQPKKQFQLITGAMRCGKTRMLTMIIQKNNGTYIDCEPNTDIKKTIDSIRTCTGIVCIDEFQFLIGDNIQDELMKLYNDELHHTRKIYIGMLQFDWKRDTFENYTILTNLKDNTNNPICHETKMVTTCEVCGDPAYDNVRIMGGDALYVKNKNYYVTCCTQCGDILMLTYNREHVHTHIEEDPIKQKLVEKYLLDKI